MLLLAAIALIAIGPKQLPEVARMIGRFLKDIKKVRDEFTRSITDTREDGGLQSDKPFGEMFQSTYTPPPYQVDVAAQHAIAATENRVIDVPAVAENASEIAADEHNQIAFDLSAPEKLPVSTTAATTKIVSNQDPDRKDH